MAEVAPAPVAVSYVPSGAIAGLDGIKSACVGAITHVTHDDAQAARWASMGRPILVQSAASRWLA